VLYKLLSGNDFAFLDPDLGEELDGADLHDAWQAAGEQILDWHQNGVPAGVIFAGARPPKPGYPWGWHAFEGSQGGRFGRRGRAEPGRPPSGDTDGD
jgi:hypothetical protein